MARRNLIVETHGHIPHLAIVPKSPAHSLPLTQPERKARDAKVRMVFDQMVASSRPHWVVGVPTAMDLDVTQKRVAALMGLTAEDVANALKGHPRPATVG